MSEASLAGITAADYLQMIQSLLPTGPAWPKDPDAVQTIFWSAVAAELKKIHDRSTQLLSEVTPSTTNEMLSDWERVVGLPDECTADQIVGFIARRANLVQRLNAVGGQSKSYFIGLAATLGFTITIDEFRPFLVGQSTVGQPLSNGAWMFTWRVNAPLNTLTAFRVGQSAVGDPLAQWGNAPLECAIRRVAPAHTNVLFGYS